MFNRYRNLEKWDAVLNQHLEAPRHLSSKWLHCHRREVACGPGGGGTPLQDEVAFSRLE